MYRQRHVPGHVVPTQICILKRCPTTEGRGDGDATTQPVSSLWVGAIPLLLSWLYPLFLMNRCQSLAFSYTFPPRPTAPPPPAPSFPQQQAVSDGLVRPSGQQHHEPPEQSYSAPLRARQARRSHRERRSHRTSHHRGFSSDPLSLGKKTLQFVSVVNGNPSFQTCFI